MSTPQSCGSAPHGRELLTGARDRGRGATRCPRRCSRPRGRRRRRRFARDPRPAGRLPLHAQVVLAELVDDAVRDDRRPDEAAADREVADPAVQGRLARRSGSRRDRSLPRCPSPAAPPRPRRPRRRSACSPEIAGDPEPVQDAAAPGSTRTTPEPRGEPERAVRVGDAALARDAATATRCGDLARPRVDPQHLRSAVLGDPQEAAAGAETAARDPRASLTAPVTLRVAGFDADEPLLRGRRSHAEPPANATSHGRFRDRHLRPDADAPDDSSRSRVDKVERVRSQ